MCCPGKIAAGESPYHRENSGREVTLPGKENREKLDRKLLDCNLSTAVGVCLPVEFIRGHLKRIDVRILCLLVISFCL